MDRADLAPGDSSLLLRGDLNAVLRVIMLWLPTTPPKLDPAADFPLLGVRNPSKFTE